MWVWIQNNAQKFPPKLNFALFWLSSPLIFLPHTKGHKKHESKTHKYEVNLPKLAFSHAAWTQHIAEV